MPAPTQKLFGHWFGAVLAEFEDREEELHADGLAALAGMNVPVRDGRFVVLTNRVMAVLLRCGVDTITNYTSARTIAQTDKLALFWAHFPAAAVEYAAQHLDSLRPSSPGAECVAELRRDASKVVSGAAVLGELATEATADGHVDESEESAIHRATAAGRVLLDKVDAGVERCARPIRGLFRRAPRTV